MKKVRCRLFSATLIWLMEVNVNSPDNYACRWRREPSVDLGDSAPLVPPATDQGSKYAPGWGRLDGAMVSGKR